jgi:predicted transcriptional regulator of viral defense system
MTLVSKKTLGPRESGLITGLYETGKPVFMLSDASQLTGLNGQSLQNMIHRLTNKGIVTRLKSGLYAIVPFELGHVKDYMPNPYLVARAIAQQQLKKKDGAYYISYASAMDIHQMVTQPQFVVYVTTNHQVKFNSTVRGTDYRFVTAQNRHFFGFKKFWIDKSQMVYVSDLEKTVLDGLKMPAYCGGISEVAKGFWMKRDKIKVAKLIDYAERLNVGAVYRRLGFLLEIYDAATTDELNRLQSKLTKTYSLLDPTLPKDGRYVSRWRLNLNVEPDELLAVVRT